VATPRPPTVHHSRDNVTPPLEAPLCALDITRYRVRIILEWTTTRVVTYGPVEDAATKGDEGTPIRHRAENEACKRRTRATSRVELHPSRGGRNSELRGQSVRISPSC